MNLSQAHRAIYDAGLTPCTSGNASERADAFMTIKASGASCRDVVFTNVRLKDGRCDLGLKPSTDSEAHRYIYNNRPDVNAIIHTHSTYVCAWAAIGGSLPIALTEQADIFGENLFVTPNYSDIGGDAMGREFCNCRSEVHTLILRNHGLLTTGPTLEKAVQRAIMAEHVCKSLAIALSMSKTIVLLPREAVAANHKRYSESYGQ